MSATSRSSWLSFAGAYPAFAERKAVIAIIIIGVAATLPVMAWGIPSGGDLLNHFRFAQPFFESIQSGHLYPGWLAESNYGFGDARFRFYPPGLYYLLALFRLGTNWYYTTVLTFAFLSVLGGLGTYYWARTSLSTNIAMWAGLIYVVAPYHLNELYQASLLSEYAACSVLPFVFAFIERVCKRGGKGNIAGLGASYAILVLTHLPLTVIGSLAIAIYAVLLLSRKQLWSTIGKLTLGLLLGLAASAFFWTTMLVELPWIKGNSANQNIYYDYKANFLFSSAALMNRNTWYANLLALAVVGTLLPAVILFKKKVSGSTVKVTAPVTMFSFLMATELSRPLWVMIPKLREVQFPWRWLAITSLCGSILLAASWSGWMDLLRNRIRPLHFIPVLGVLLALIFTATQVVWDGDYLPQGEFNRLLASSRAAAGFKDWQPIAAGEDIKIFAPSERVSASARNVSITDWKPEHRQFNINAGVATNVRVRTFYYPLWKATTDGRSLSTRADRDGAILISAPADATTINLDFREPPRVAIVRIISIMAWLTIALMIAWNALTQRRSISFRIPASVSIGP